MLHSGYVKPSFMLFLSNISNACITHFVCQKVVSQLHSVFLSFRNTTFEHICHRKQESEQNHRRKITESMQSHDNLIMALVPSYPKCCLL